MYSHGANFDNAFTSAEQYMCQIPLKYLKEQVAVASACLSCDRTKSYRCPHASAAQCAICTRYLTDSQRRELALGSCIVLHMKCHLPEPSTKIVKFNTLPTPFVDLLKTIPRFKHWRVITCREVSNVGGVQIWKVLCSCGYGQRHLMACLHCSFVVQKVTLQQQFGCDIENIHIRHTNLYASLKDVTKVERTHCDWKGVHFTAVEADIFTVFPPPPEDDHEDEDDGQDGEGGDDGGGHDHGTRERQRKQQVLTEQLLKKKERISVFRSQMFEILNVLEATSCQEFDDTHAPVVETGLLDIRGKLPMFPQRVLSCVARRPAGQQKRRGAGGGGAAKRTATLPAARTAAQQNEVVTISSSQTSDSDVPERNFHWNAMTRQYEYRSSGASGNSSDEMDNDDSATGPPQQQHRNRMYLLPDGGAWYIDSQPEPGA